MVIAWKDKGKISSILGYVVKTWKRQLRKKPQTFVLVKDVNVVKRAKKWQGYVEFEKPVNVSNVMFYDEEAKATSKITIVEQDWKRKRKVVKTNRILDN